MDTIKLLLIGPKWSGKTTLANRLCYGTFGCASRDGVDRFAATVKTSMASAQLMMYDVSTSMLDRLVECDFVRFVDAVVCVHDAQVEDWSDSVGLFDTYAHRVCPDALVFRVFTKSDVSARQFSKEDLACSAATGFNVQQVFSEIATRVQRSKLRRIREQSAAEMEMHKNSGETQESQESQESQELQEDQDECREEESEDGARRELIR